MRKILTQGRYATVTSTAALVLALSGTAYAINTVDSIDIVNDSIQSIDVHNEGLSGTDIADGTIRTADVANDTLTQSDFALGAAVPARFAFVNGATGQASPADDVSSSSHTGVGTYRLTFASNQLNGCAVVATPGERNGALADPGSTATANLESGAGAVIVRTAVNGTLQDVSFNLGLFC